MSIDKFINGVADSTNIHNVVLSPSATQVVYTVAPTYKPASRTTDVSTLWISDVAPGSKSRQLTSGDHNDTSPAWATDESVVYFLSDRHKQDDKPGPAAIYALPLKAGGEAYALTSKESKSAIGSFVVSPDGRCIAYTAAREPTEEEKRKEKEKDDPMVFGDNKANSQLWLLSVGTRQVRRLELGAKDNWNVLSATWSPDSKDLMVLANANSAWEFKVSPIAVIRVSTLPNVSGQVQEVCTLPWLRAAALLWPSPDEVALVQSYIPEHISSSVTFYFHPASPQGGKSDAWKRHYGDVEDINELIDLHDGKTVAVGVAYGVDTRVDLITSSTSRKTLWLPDGEAPNGLWDLKLNKKGEYVLAMVCSSGVKSEPSELWAGTLSSSELDKGKTLKLSDKLSSHHSWADELPKLSLEIIKYKSSKDGTALDGIVVWPKNKERKALPTVLFPHGGPYHRDTPDFDVVLYWSKDVLAIAGYLVLCPEYRGSAGRGHDFARTAHAGMGTLDWSDSYDLLQYAIAQGWADKNKLGLAGWSQGGFLTAWGVSQTKDLFKAAVMGAGVSDWGAMAVESDSPEFEADLGGSWPWSDNRVDQNGSPIKHMTGIKTPVLILHGQNDLRVPCAQGVAFHRGLRRASGYPENHQLVVYPREPHGFTEKEHAKDVMRRLIEHMDAYVK